jgi:hypothetical protein
LVLEVVEIGAHSFSVEETGAKPATISIIGVAVPTLSPPAPKTDRAFGRTISAVNGNSWSLNGHVQGNECARGGTFPYSGGRGDDDSAIERWLSVSSRHGWLVGAPSDSAMVATSRL